jgi:ribosome-associated heat shock protein Hsp15
MNHTPGNPRVRLDKWLWAARFFKTRGLAKAAIERGKVQIGGERCKVSREVEAGMTLQIRQGQDEFEVVVQAVSEQRGPAPQARLLYNETEASRVRREKAAAERKALAASQPTSPERPTKKQRRQIYRFREVMREAD